MLTMWRENFRVALIMHKDPKFNPAYEGLDSTDFNTFEASKRTLQQCTLDAIHLLIKQCPKCNGSDFCSIHQHMLIETENMLNAEDAPQFKGNVPS